MERTYLDAATSMPVRNEVLEEMIPYFKTDFGNPSTNHEMGRRPRQAMERARGEVSDLIMAGSDTIIFTSGATESILGPKMGCPSPLLNIQE